tara:strand:- start:52 stop:996 length:945 start_codon:yes stop_codon:yes gene_type:complete
MVQADDGTIYATYKKELLTYEMYVGGRFLNIHDPASGLAAINSVTGTEFDETGLTITGSRFGSDGYDVNGADEWGYDRNGNVAYDANGFSLSTGIHLDTGTAFNSGGFAQNGTKYDSNGYNMNGFNVSGVHTNGTLYGDDGYDVDGYNANGVFTDGTSVRNGYLAGAFQMEHKVARESFFKTIVEKAKIENAGDTKIGKFIIRNNTKDGYSLSIQTVQGGKLHPASTDDGESDIPYSITIVKEGAVGVGIDTKYNFTSNELVSETNILSRAGSSVSAATNAEFELFVNIAQDQSEILGLSGTYTDTITLTYTDL